MLLQTQEASAPPTPVVKTPEPASSGLNEDRLKAQYDSWASAVKPVISAVPAKASAAPAPPTTLQSGSQAAWKPGQVISDESSVKSKAPAEESKSISAEDVEKLMYMSPDQAADAWGAMKSAKVVCLVTSIGLDSEHASFVCTCCGRQYFFKPLRTAKSEEQLIVTCSIQPDANSHASAGG